MPEGKTRIRRQVTENTRRCRTCNQVKGNEEFYSFIRRDRANRPDKRYHFTDCKKCQSELSRLARYGVTLAEMIERQGTALCPLCETRMADSVDHDHETGNPRGALCRKCNLIMHYMDDPAWHARAEVYLARSK